VRVKVGARRMDKNPPFVVQSRSCVLERWGGIAHDASTGVLDEEGRRQRTATMRNLLGGANYLAGGAAGARCGASWVFITLLSTQSLHGVRMPDACADVHCRRRHILNAGLRAGYRPGLLNYRALGNGVLEVYAGRATPRRITKRGCIKGATSIAILCRWR